MRYGTVPSLWQRARRSMPASPLPPVTCDHIWLLVSPTARPCTPGSGGSQQQQLRWPWNTVK